MREASPLGPVFLAGAGQLPSEAPERADGPRYARHGAARQSGVAEAQVSQIMFDPGFESAVRCVSGEKGRFLIPILCGFPPWDGTKWQTSADLEKALRWREVGACATGAKSKLPSACARPRVCPHVEASCVSACGGLVYVGGSRVRVHLQQQGLAGVTRPTHKSSCSRGQG